MRIFYDISVLGAAYNHTRARTGVFRVVENLAYGLANSAECTLTFCVGESLPTLYACLDYLEFNSRLQNVPVHYGRIIKIRRNLEKQVLTLSAEISKESITSKSKIFSLKVIRKLSYHATRMISNYPIPLITPKSLDLVDIFHSPFYPIPSQIKKNKKKKIFITVYDLIPVLYPKFFQFNEDGLIKNVLKSIDSETWVTCISHSTKNDLCNYLPQVDPSRVKVTHLAASELFYPSNNHEENRRVKKKYNIPEAPYLLSLSTLEPRKNIDHTIRCFANLVQQENINDLCLVLVGSKGWDYNKIFDEISNYQFLKDRIIVTGYVADEDLAALYSGALAFVYPSLYEGFGLPPLEAMQCGIPVITSNTSSLPEVVGDAGIMVSPTDADTLCQSMLEIYYNPSLREVLSLKSLERAKQFSWKKCTQETINAYKTALSS
jgi:glycosyltransferase involved in cell wall biosynthesis